MILEVLALTAPSIVVIVGFIIYMKSRNNPTAKQSKANTVAHIHPDETPQRLVGLRENERIRQNEAEQRINNKIDEIHEAIKRLGKVETPK